MPSCSFLVIINNHAEPFSGVLNANLLVAVTIEVVALTATKNSLYGTNFTISVASDSTFLRFVYLFDSFISYDID